MMHAPRDPQEVLALLAGRARGPLLGLAAGTVATSVDLIERCDRELTGLDFICSKSFQVRANPGNPAPILVEPRPGCFGNAVGLRNMGLNQGVAEFTALRNRRSLRSLLIISLAGSRVEDFILLVQAFAPLADALELNFSCPHSAGHGTAIGCDPELVRSYLQALRPLTTRPLVAKLSCNCTEVVGGIAAIAEAARSGGADAISAINTVGPARYCEPVSGEPLLRSRGEVGGQSGLWVQLQALQAVREIAAAVDLPLIGCGGVDSPQALRAMLAAGATAVAVGSAFARVPSRSWANFSNWLKTGCSPTSGLAKPAGRRQVELLPPLRYHAASLLDCQRGPFYHCLRLSCPVELGLGSGGLAFLWQGEAGEHALPFVRVDQDVQGCWQGLFWLANEVAESFDLRPGARIFWRHRPEQNPVLIDSNTVLLGWQRQLPWLLAWLACQRGWGEGGQRALGEFSPAVVLLTDPQSAATLTSLLPASISLQSCQDPQSLLVQLFAQGQLLVLYLAALPQLARKIVAELLRQGMAAENIHLSLPRQFLCGAGLCGSCQWGGHLFCSDGLFAPLDRWPHDRELA